MRAIAGFALAVGALAFFAACAALAGVVLMWTANGNSSSSVPGSAGAATATATRTALRVQTRPPGSAPSAARPQSTPVPVPTATASTANPPANSALVTPAPGASERPTATPLPTAPPTSRSELYIDSFDSTIMGDRMPYMMYLPPGYSDEDDKRYPVLYLLHGWGGDLGEWAELGGQDAADELIRSGAIPPMIIAAPEGDKAYWFNHFGGPRWGDYAAIEFVDYVDANFRTLARRENRGIAGLSMGGQGALALALNHSDRFALVGLRSPSWRRPGDPDTPDFFGDEAYFRQFDPREILRAARPANPLRTYVINGDVDQWNYRTDEILDQLRGWGMPVERHVFPGDHDLDFFKSHMLEDMRFFGAWIGTDP